MKNLYLDEDTKDLEISNNNIRFTQNNTEFVSQKLENKLLFFAREWFLNFTLGIPYLAENNEDRDDNTKNILVKNPDLNFINNIYLVEIASVEGIERIVRFDVVYDSSSRRYKLEYSVQVTTGEIVSNSVEV